MEKNSPLVSIITPTYKRSLTLPRTIKSVLNSTYKNVEIIVVDDNNEGDEFRLATEKLMKQYVSVPEVHYLKHKVNKNGSAARNTGIRAAQGKYIMFLDDDDEFLPEKIERQIACMEALDDSWGACYTKYLDVKPNGEVISKCAEKKQGSLLVYELARNLFVHAGSNLMVRKTVVDELNGFDESFLRNQDVEFLVRLLKKYKLAFVDYVGLKVYIHPRKYVIKYKEITATYLNKFEKEIAALPVEDSAKVHKMIALQLIRNAFEEKQFCDIRTLAVKNGISWCVIIKYFCHLAYRRATKQSCGFPMENL